MWAATTTYGSTYLLMNPAHIMPAPYRTYRQTEDGEAIGTLQQFARAFNVPRSSVTDCIQSIQSTPIVIEPGSGQDHIIIADKNNLQHLRSCLATKERPRG